LIQSDSPLPKMTSDNSAVRYIEFAVRERAKCSRDSQEYYSEFINGCPTAWRIELLERLRTLNVCGSQPVAPTPSKRLQGDLGPGGIFEACPIEKYVQISVDVELFTPASMVCSCFVISEPYSVLIICSPQTTSRSSERERESEESNFLAPAKSLSSGERALHRLISGPHPGGELTSLIEAVFSSTEAICLAGCLQESDAQTFIDILYEVHFHSSIPKNGLINVVADLSNLNRPWRTSTLH